VTPSADHPENPFYPLATATMQTTVFDVVHMFSELGISAVPIVDAHGKVVNLYETVDVIVSEIIVANRESSDTDVDLMFADTGTNGSIPRPRSNNRTSPGETFSRFRRGSYMYAGRFVGVCVPPDSDA
jgi:CBS domain-containing protein